MLLLITSRAESLRSGRFTGFLINNSTERVRKVVKLFDSVIVCYPGCLRSLRCVPHSTRLEQHYSCLPNISIYNIYCGSGWSLTLMASMSNLKLLQTPDINRYLKVLMVSICKSLLKEILSLILLHCAVTQETVTVELCPETPASVQHWRLGAFRCRDIFDTGFSNRCDKDTD